MSRITTSRYLFALVLSFALQACGGGGGGGDPTPPTNVPNAVPTGYYNNIDTTTTTGSATVFEDDDTTPRALDDLQGMIHNGRFVLMSFQSRLAYNGDITVNGNNYSGSVTVYRNGTAITTATVNGTIAQGSTITGTLGGTGAGRGSFVLVYSPKNTEAAALSIAGRFWSRPIGGSSTSFAFSVDPTTGNMTTSATTTNGVFQSCAFGAGSTMAPISGQHLYTVSLTLTGCNNSLLNGAYTGLATTRAAQDDALPFVVTNGTYSLHTEF